MNVRWQVILPKWLEHEEFLLRSLFLSGAWVVSVYDFLEPGIGYYLRVNY